MKLYMFSKLLCTYFPYQRHNTPAYAYGSQRRGSSRVTGPRVPGPTSFHSRLGTASGSFRDDHLRTSYGLHTNHQIQLGEDDFWDILGIDFDVKVCKLYQIVFIVVFRCTVLLLLHVSCQFNSTCSYFSVHSPNYFCLSAYCILLI